MRGLYLPLTRDEREALVELAKCEKRDTRQQAALLIRQSLEKLGWLKPQTPTEEADHEPTA